MRRLFGNEDMKKRGGTLHKALIRVVTGLAIAMLVCPIMASADNSTGESVNAKGININRNWAQSHGITDTIVSNGQWNGYSDGRQHAIWPYLETGNNDGQNNRVGTWTLPVDTVQSQRGLGFVVTPEQNSNVGNSINVNSIPSGYHLYERIVPAGEPIYVSQWKLALLSMSVVTTPTAAQLPFMA